MPHRFILADETLLQQLTAVVRNDRALVIEHRLIWGPRRPTMALPPNKPRNLLRLAGVINAANTEADNEAGELIERVRRNKARTLGLIAKGHHNEALREQMLSEAEKEQALADLAAAVGDNGGPLLVDEEPDEDEVKILADLKAAKQDATSQSSNTGQQEQHETKVPEMKLGEGSPAVGQAATFPGDTL
jgi:hypothetical protein